MAQKKMKYRKIDADGSRSAILRDMALQADREAFSEELEATRQARTLKLLKLEGEQADRAAEVLQQAGRDAKRSRRRADVLRKRAKVALDDEAFIDGRYELVDGWMEAVEKEHLTKTIQLENLEGTSAATEEERHSLQHDLIVLESAHDLAIELTTEFRESIDAREPVEEIPPGEVEVIHLPPPKE